MPSREHVLECVISMHACGRIHFAREHSISGAVPGKKLPESSIGLRGPEWYSVTRKGKTDSQKRHLSQRVITSIDER